MLNSSVVKQLCMTGNIAEWVYFTQRKTLPCNINLTIIAVGCITYLMCEGLQLSIAVWLSVVTFRNTINTKQLTHRINCLYVELPQYTSGNEYDAHEFLLHLLMKLRIDSRY